MPPSPPPLWMRDLIPLFDPPGARASTALSIRPEFHVTNAAAGWLNAPQRNQQCAVGQRSNRRLAEGEVLPLCMFAGGACLGARLGPPDDLVCEHAEMRLRRSNHS